MQTLLKRLFPGRAARHRVPGGVYRQIFETATDGLVILDMQGNIVEINPTLCAIHGQCREAVLGLFVGQFIHPDSHPIFRSCMDRVTQGECAVYQARHWHSDGRIIDVEVRGTPMSIDGKPYVLATVSDISRHKTTERKLTDYAQALESANHCLEEYSFVAQAAVRGKSEFLANLSHEIRTPITAILGFAELLRTDGDIAKAPPARIEAIDTIIRNGDHLMRLLNGVLDISKIEAGRFDLEIQPCSPSQLVCEVRKLQEASARAKNLGVEIHCGGLVPETIHSDPTRLRQILSTW